MGQSQGFEQKYGVVEAHNKALANEISEISVRYKGKEAEASRGREKLEELTRRHEQANEALMLEIYSLNEELQQYKKNATSESEARKYKEEAIFYRNQCDSLAAQLSRAQALARRGK